MAIFDRYKSAVDAKQIEANPMQEAVIDCLQPIYDRLVAHYHQSQRLWYRLLKGFHHNNALVEGLYLWGGVGIGKTYLLDLFYDTLPFSEKLRIHFHDFMRIVHERLHEEEGRC